MLCKHLLEEDNKDPFAITPNPEETAFSICGEASRVTTVWWTPALASEWLCDELWCMSQPSTSGSKEPWATSSAGLSWENRSNLDHSHHKWTDYFIKKCLACFLCSFLERKLCLGVEKKKMSSLYLFSNTLTAMIRTSLLGHQRLDLSPAGMETLA